MQYSLYIDNVSVEIWSILVECLRRSGGLKIVAPFFQPIAKTLLYVTDNACSPSLLNLLLTLISRLKGVHRLRFCFESPSQMMFVLSFTSFHFKVVANEVGMTFGLNYFTKDGDEIQIIIFLAGKIKSKFNIEYKLKYKN